MTLYPLARHKLNAPLTASLLQKVDNLSLKRLSPDLDKLDFHISLRLYSTAENTSDISRAVQVFVCGFRRQLRTFLSCFNENQGDGKRKSLRYWTSEDKTHS